MLAEATSGGWGPWGMGWWWWWKGTRSLWLVEEPSVLVMCSLPGFVNLQCPLQAFETSDSAGSLGAPHSWWGGVGEVLHAHLFWVWIFKELGRLQGISEVLGKAWVADPELFFKQL